MCLTPYLKQLEEELESEDVERLQKKVKQSKDLKNSLEYLSSSLVPSSWPMSGFELMPYNSSYPIPYSNFLELNSASFSMYVPYSSCDDISICVQKGFIIDMKSITLITLGRRVSIYLNHMPICRFTHTF